MDICFIKGRKYVDQMRDLQLFKEGLDSVELVYSLQTFFRSVNHTLDINSVFTAIYVGDLCFLT
jgi:aryl carrier-like protein